MRVAIDLTNSPHVPFFAPLVRRLEAAGHGVELTARRFAQTVELARLHELDAAIIGEHGGATRRGKAIAAARRTRALVSYLRRLHRERRFDLALSHGSTDLPIACRLLGIPHVTMFDYEFAVAMHTLNWRNSWKVMTPDAIPPSRLARYGTTAKLVQYPGLKEEYYLRDAVPVAGYRARLGVPDDDVLLVLRPPPALALYHRGADAEVFEQVLRRASSADGVSTVVLARTDEQREALDRADWLGPSVRLPAEAVDAVSLMAEADLVVSAGGTMNREAVALGVPVHTVFAGRMGAVDEQLIRQGRLHQLERADELRFEPRARSGDWRLGLRDPQLLIDLATEGLPQLLTA